MTGKRFLERKATSERAFFKTADRISQLVRYFGRAKDLPGVRELFQSRKDDEEEENKVFAHYKRFLNRGPPYYGDVDDTNPQLLAYEQSTEEDGELKLKTCMKVTN